MTAPPPTTAISSLAPLPDNGCGLICGDLSMHEITLNVLLNFTGDIEFSAIAFGETGGHCKPGENKYLSFSGDASKGYQSVDLKIGDALRGNALKSGDVLKFFTDFRSSGTVQYSVAVILYQGSKKLLSRMFLTNKGDQSVDCTGDAHIFVEYVRADGLSLCDLFCVAEGVMEGSAITVILG